MTRQLHAHAASQHLHGTFRRGVWRNRVAAQLALHRTDVDHFSCLTRHHTARNGLRDEKNRGLIYGDDVIPLLLGKLSKRMTALDTGVIYQDVNDADIFSICSTAASISCLWVTLKGAAIAFIPSC